MKRVTIARDGTVRLRGVRTGWRIAVLKEIQNIRHWNVCGPTGGKSCIPRPDAIAYLESLTDEELMG